MQTQTTIANLALSHIANQRIVSIDDAASPTAEILRTQWDNTRRTALRAFLWNFATTPAVLTERLDAATITACDVYEYAHGWALPADYINVYKFNGIEAATGRTPWKIAGATLYADDTTAKLEYIRDVEDCSLWPDDFATAMSWFLAAAIAPSMSSDPKLGMSLLSVAQNLLKSAESGDTHEEGRLHILRGLQHSPYMMARRNYGGITDNILLEAMAYRDFNPP